MRLDELEQHLFAALNATVVINIESARRDEQALHELLARNLTDDRVFGVLSCHHLDEFFDPDKLNRMRQQIEAIPEGLVVVYGRARRWRIPAMCWCMPICRAGKFNSVCVMTVSVTGAQKPE